MTEALKYYDLIDNKTATIYSGERGSFCLLLSLMAGVIPTREQRNHVVM